MFLFMVKSHPHPSPLHPHTHTLALTPSPSHSLPRLPLTHPSHPHTLLPSCPHALLSTHPLIPPPAPSHHHIFTFTPSASHTRAHVVHTQVADYMLQAGQALCVTGSLPSLGFWQADSMLALTGVCMGVHGVHGVALNSARFGGLHVVHLW